MLALYSPTRELNPVEPLPAREVYLDFFVTLDNISPESGQYEICWRPLVRDAAGHS
jgi:hypothetical protein